MPSLQRLHGDGPCHWSLPGLLAGCHAAEVRPVKYLSPKPFSSPPSTAAFREGFDVAFGVRGSKRKETMATLLPKAFLKKTAAQLKADHRRAVKSMDEWLARRKEPLRPSLLNGDWYVEDPSGKHTTKKR